MAIIARQEITITFVVDIKETYRYYLLQDSALVAPTTPATYPPNSKWSLTEPSYSEGSTDNLYVVECTVFTNDTFSYSNVSLSSSYEASKAAYTKAVEAKSSADGLQTDVSDLSVRMTSAETNITKTDEEIALRATYEEVESSINSNVTTLMNQGTEIIQNCQELIMSALEEYSATGEFGEYKESVETRLSNLAGQLEITVNQTISDMAKINDEVTRINNTMEKYFSFTVDGLTIGQKDSPYKVVIDNDRYSMMVNDAEIMYIADGKVFTPSIEITNAFKLFEYTFDKDASGNVNCG